MYKRQNIYGSINGRLELNTHLNSRLNSNWSTGIYIHADTRNQTFDKNKDSFLDMPLAKQINVMNKWQYTNLEKGLVTLINFRFLDDQKQTGQADYNPSIHKFGGTVWGSEVDTKRFDFSGKFGYINPEITYQSLGFQLAYSQHEQAAYFGNRIYDIDHKIKKWENIQINWNESAKKVLAKINGLNPNPGAWFEFDKERFKVLKAKASSENERLISESESTRPTTFSSTIMTSAFIVSIAVTTFPPLINVFMGVYSLLEVRRTQS